MISVLGVSSTSVYKFLDVDCYDIKRDMLNFSGDNPVITHAPCRSWSKFLSAQAKPLPGEKDLAPFCAELVKSNGGIFEHPAHSLIFNNYLPLPGEGSSDLFTLEVHQSWWNYPTIKKTWLCFSKIDLDLIEFPFNLLHPQSCKYNDIFANMSRNQRSATTLEFAIWLINLASQVKKTPVGHRG